MPREGDHSLDYSKVKRSVIKDDIYYDPAIVKVKDPGLHAKCSGCQHTIDNKTCRFVQTPKTKRFPCCFKDSPPRTEP